MHMMSVELFVAALVGTAKQWDWMKGDLGINVGADEAARGRCPSAEALLELFCMAEISLPKLNYIARCAIISDPQHPDLVSLAELGDSGRYAGNLRRDILRTFLDEDTLPPPLIINDVPAVNNINHNVWVDQAVLNLCQFVETMWSDHRDAWDEMFGTNPRSFWEGVSHDDPRLHFMGDITSVDGWEDTAFPCILHGDGGVYTRKTESSILVVSMKSLLNTSFAK